MTEISTEQARLDRDLIHGFLSTEAYWARGRPRERTERAIERSLCFGAYAPDGAQVGFARVVTDGAMFAYLADVFVVRAARGRGVATELIAAVLAHPDTQGVKRMLLATEDAHGLYARFGFLPLDDVPKWLALRRG